MNSIVTRAAKIEDAKLLFAWRNDPLTRQNSISSAPISWNDHLKWLTDSLASRERQIYIAEIENEPFATFRLDHTTEGIELSWTVAPEFRSRGLGSQLITTLMKSMRYGPKTFIAKIKACNLPSIAIAEKAGFVRDHENEGLIVFVRIPEREEWPFWNDPSRS